MESENGPIETPLGPLTVDPSALTTLLNHNRIVWQMPKSFKEKTCTMQELFKGDGNATVTKKQGKLMDPKNQIEILFDIDIEIEVL